MPMFGGAVTTVDQEARRISGRKWRLGDALLRQFVVEFGQMHGQQGYGLGRHQMPGCGS